MQAAKPPWDCCDPSQLSEGGRSPGFIPLSKFGIRHFAPAARGDAEPRPRRFSIPRLPKLRSIAAVPGRLGRGYESKSSQISSRSVRKRRRLSTKLFGACVSNQAALHHLYCVAAPTKRCFTGFSFT